MIYNFLQQVYSQTTTRNDKITSCIKDNPPNTLLEIPIHLYCDPVVINRYYTIHIHHIHHIHRI
jgi:hypothetical protein